MARYYQDAATGLRMTLAIAWTLASIYILLLPGDTPVIEGLAALLKNVGFAIGHVFGFGVLAALWQWALMPHLTTRWAMSAALVIAMIVGLGTEVAQISVEGRGADGVDLTADMCGAALAVIWLHRVEGGRRNGRSAIES